MKELRAEEFNKNPFQLIGREWMLVTAKKRDKINTMTASWGGLGIMWDKKVAFIAIRPSRYTKEFIDSANTLSLTFYEKEYKKQLAYLGSVSGREEDKITKSNLTVQYEGETPYFKEASIAVICKKLFHQEFSSESFIEAGLEDKFYPGKDYHTMYIAEIEKILVSE
jgi:flavin reductase (DIM6/NTAB) family NADH-FMN oxidoreductase RutF